VANQRQLKHMNVNPLPRQPTSDGAIPRCKVDDREGIQHALQERGCCICTSVASSTERKEGVKLFWNYVENLNVGVTRGRADTMGNSTWNRLCFPKNGVIAGGGIGQSDFMWHCRLLPNVRKCFQHAWGGDRDLITSLTGVGLTEIRGLRSNQRRIGPQRVVGSILTKDLITQVSHRTKGSSISFLQQLRQVQPCLFQVHTTTLPLC